MEDVDQEVEAIEVKLQRPTYMEIVCLTQHAPKTTNRMSWCHPTLRGFALSLYE